MNIDESTHELIDQYLQGTLPAGHPFAERIKTDQSLREEVQVQKLLQQAVVDFRLLEVEKIIAEGREHFIKEHTSKFKWKLWSVIFIFLGSGIYFLISMTREEKISASKKSSMVAPPGMHVNKPDTAPDSDYTAYPVRPNGSSRKPDYQFGKTPKSNPSHSPKDTQEARYTPNIFKAPLSDSFSRTDPLPPKAITGAGKLPCEGILIKAWVEETQPCSTAHDGRIKILSAQGGKAPYHYSIDGQLFQEENTFEHLKAGAYKILLKDENGCETLLHEQYVLPSQPCISFPEHAFNPQVNTWEVPAHPDKAGEITILDGEGQMDYYKPFQRGEKINWTGVHQSGSLLAPGAYIYTIKYEDGTLEQGRITIIY